MGNNVIKKPFSIRHKKLINEKSFNIKLSLQDKRKIINLLNKYNELNYKIIYTGFMKQSSYFDKVYDELLNVYGYEKLKAYKDSKFTEVYNLIEFILGTKTELVLDVIELFFDHIENEKKQDFVNDMNNFFQIIDVPLRFSFDGEFYIIDSEFVENEILEKAEKLLREENFESAYIHFNDARNRLSSGDYEGTVLKANNALESYLKNLFNQKNASQNDLIKLCIKNNIFPDYYKGFLENFKGIFQSAFTIANQSSRHGQSKVQEEKNKIDGPIANFLLSLVGILIIFIVDRYNENNINKEIKDNNTQ